MKTDRIFIGDIKKCTEYNPVYSSWIDNECFSYVKQENILYKKDAVLIKTKSGLYIDIDYININTYFNIFTMSKSDEIFISICPENFFMDTLPYCKGSLFIDKNSLKSYKEKNPEIGNRTLLMKLKRQYKK